MLEKSDHAAILLRSICKQSNMPANTKQYNLHCTVQSDAWSRTLPPNQELDSYCCKAIPVIQSVSTSLQLSDFKDGQVGTENRHPLDENI